MGTSQQLCQMTALSLPSPLLDRGYSVREVTWRTEEGPRQRCRPQPGPRPSTARAHTQVPLVDGRDDLQMPWQQLLKQVQRSKASGSTVWLVYAQVFFVISQA